MVKRPFTVLVMMLALTACGADRIDIGGTTGAGTAGAGTAGAGTAGAGTAGAGTAGAGTTGAGGSSTGDGGTNEESGTGGGSGYSTVSGLVVHGDTGAPYPNAYVRFGWLVNATTERETHTVTGADGRYSIKLPAGLYEASAGDLCDLNAAFTIAGRHPDDNQIEVPGTAELDFVESPIVPGYDGSGPC